MYGDIFVGAVFTTTTDFDYGTISGRIRELAFLNPQVCLLMTASLYVICSLIANTLESITCLPLYIVQEVT